MAYIDYDTASQIVRSLYPNAADPMLDLELEATKGDSYRPYAVAAKFMMTNYRQVIRAKDVTFQYDANSIRQILNLQRGNDLTDKNIPEGQTVDDLEAILCETCEDKGGIGINVY